MSESIFNDPDVQEFLRHAQEEMIPKMKESALSLAIITGQIDAKLCVEVGAAILYDKPLILVVTDEGAQIPTNLKRCAAAIVNGSLRDDDAREKLQEEVQKALTYVLASDGRVKKKG